MNNDFNHNSACSNCGNQLQPSEKFCTKCGAPAEQAPKNFCKVCGTPYKQGTAFCTTCGNNLINTDTKNNSKNAQTLANQERELTSRSTTKKSSIFSHPTAIFHIISIVLIAIIFICALLPAFTFKATLDADSYEKNIDRLTKKAQKEAQEEVYNINEELNDSVQITLFHPFQFLSDEISANDESVFGTLVKTAYTLSIICAVIQAIAYLGTILTLVLALFKPINVKVAKVFPIIGSICAIIYSLFVFAFFTFVIKLAFNYSYYIKINTSLTTASIIYLLSAIALFVITIISNKKKKELSV